MRLSRACACVVSSLLILVSLSATVSAGDDAEWSVGDSWAYGTDNALGFADNATLTEKLMESVSMYDDYSWMEYTDVLMEQFSQLYITFKVVGENSTAYQVEMNAAFRLILATSDEAVYHYLPDGSYDSAAYNAANVKPYPGTETKMMSFDTSFDLALIISATLHVEKSSKLVTSAAAKLSFALIYDTFASNVPDTSSQYYSTYSNGYYDWGYNVTNSWSDPSLHIEFDATADLDLSFDPGLPTLKTGSPRISTEVTYEGTVSATSHVSGDYPYKEYLPWSLGDLFRFGKISGEVETGKDTAGFDIRLPVDIDMGDGLFYGISYSVGDYVKALLGLPDYGPLSDVLKDNVTLYPVPFDKAEQRIDAVDKDLSSISEEVTGQPRDGSGSSGDGNGFPWLYVGLGAVVLAALVGVLLLVTRRRG